ncbi:MAG: hypothetical protein J5J06_10215 [Phycisphaerae bacterium]|nr:hypothetical protein [Phycisphaerae bacterium]
MPSSKRNKEDLRAYSAELHPDDGIDPREDKKHTVDRTKKDDRKLQQLCKQVASVLRLVLPSLDVLTDVAVVSVVPAPNAGRLRVIVAAPDTADRQHIAMRIEHCSGYLRWEVGQAVARRRVPELVFSIISGEVTHE